MKSGIKDVTTRNLKQILKIHTEEDFRYDASVKYLDELQTRGEVLFVQGYISRNTQRWSNWERRHGE